uniref:6-cysteine protein n=1 Tax=Panagrolaimus davidi TaxID=227884 RepID=A0A914PW05_9BILA
MKSVIFLLISSCLLVRLSDAAGYTDKSGNPAPNPCKDGENVYFDTLVFNCIDGKKVYYGCKINNDEIKQDTIKDENNLRTLYCHKDGNSVKTIVTGCVTDDNQFINETKTVKQVDGTEFSCNKQSNGFSYIKKSPPTKVSDCSKGETKVVASRYALECYEESAGYFTFKLAACFSTPDDPKTRIEVTKSYDDYVSDDKQLGFRYSCHVQGNSFFYEPIGCLLGGQFISPGNIFQNGSLTVMCMRDGPQRLRLRPVYSSGNVDEKSCTETKTYIEDNFKYECQTGKQPKPIACVFFKNQKEIPIGSTYNDDKAYQYRCEQTSDSKHLALVKAACLDDENQLLGEGGKKSLSDGSRIECQKSADDGLLRVIVAGKPPFEQCKEGEKVVRDYLQYRCEGKQLKAFACAPLNNDSMIIEIGKTYDSDNYQYKCEEQSKAIIYHAIACLDLDKKVLMPGEKRQVKIFTYECQRKANNDLALVISNENGCKHPALQGKLVRPNDIAEVPRTIKQLDYKTLFQCVVGGDKGYSLVDVGCKVDGKKYDIGNYVKHQEDVYKCVRPNAGVLHLIYIPSSELICRYGNKVYRNGDEFKSHDGISQYQCINGIIVKTGCFVHDKRIPVNQLMYCNNDPYFCPGKGEGVIPIPIRGCYRKNGQLIKIGDTFNEKDIVYTCSYTQNENVFKPVIVPTGCVYNGKTIPLNSFIFFESKNIVCEVDNSFIVIVHPANPQQEQCIKKTATYNCQGNGNGNGDGGQATTPSSNNEYTATPSNGNGNNGNEQNPGTTKGGNGSGNENGFPGDDDNVKSTTPHGSTDEDDCDDSTTPAFPAVNPHDHTATGSPNGQGNTNSPDFGSTKKHGGEGNENQFPTDQEGNPVTPQDHTATGSNEGQNSHGPKDGTTKSHSGGNNEQGFPTDEEGHPITPPGHYTATGASGGLNTNNPNQQTTKKHGGSDHEQTLPTDENGNPVTAPVDYTATGGNVNTNPGQGTTKTTGNVDHGNPFPTDENGNSEQDDKN